MFLVRTRLPALKNSGFLLAILLLAIAPTLRSQAQGLPTASKTIDISVFGGYLTENPDYGPTRNKGFFVGANATRYFHWPVAPSLEVRYNRTTGQYINDSSFVGGPRIQVDLFHRFHPYADFLLGIDSIHFVRPFDPTFLNDSAIVYDLGGGIDIDLVRNFQLKLDYQGQTANFGSGFSLAPRPLSIGVVYRIPFRPNTRN
ncbi:MAG: hypothetical protein ABI147_08690 [Acidobacteriaceae bacterium]